MNKILIALILLCAGYWAAVNQEKLKAWWASAQVTAGERYQHPMSEEDNAEALAEKPPLATPAAPPTTPPTVAVASPPAPAPAPAPAPPQLPPLDPGVFYTRERITNVTDAGIAAIPERTKVRQVGEQDGKLLVEAAGKRLAVSRDQITNDPAEVAAMLKENEAQAKDALAANQPQPAPPPPDPKTVKEENNTKRRVLQAKIKELEKKVYSLDDHLYELRSQARDAKNRGRPSTYNDKAINTTLGQINELKNMISKLKLEEAAIPQ